MGVRLCRACDGHRGQITAPKRRGGRLGAHLAGDNDFKHKVRVELYDWCERAGLGVMACMQVLKFLA
jgi:hypothetical protein